MTVSRRSLFGFAAAVTAVPILKAIPAAAPPAVARWGGLRELMNGIVTPNEARAAMGLPAWTGTALPREYFIEVATEYERLILDASGNAPTVPT